MAGEGWPAASKAAAAAGKSAALVRRGLPVFQRRKARTRHAQVKQNIPLTPEVILIGYNPPIRTRAWSHWRTYLSRHEVYSGPATPALPGLLRRRGVPLLVVALLLLGVWRLGATGRVVWNGQFPYLYAGVKAPKIPERLQPPAFGDVYGGAPAHIQQGTGFFTVAKVGKRWSFITPDGDPFWLRGVYHASEAFIERDVMQQKYGGDVKLWATQRNRRLLSWGFNALGEFTSPSGVPIGIRGSAEGNAVKLPVLLLINALAHAQSVPGRLGLSDPLKDVVRGVPQTAYSRYRGVLPDLFDPHLADAFRAQIAEDNKTYTGGFADKSWVLGITPDDADFLFGLKGGPAAGHPHPVYLIAVSKFYFTSAQDSAGREFRDHKLYSKYAWVEFLKNKYGTVQALNAAWKSNYSSFDDDGGYGEGRGVLDEDGRHRGWLGSDAFLLSGANPALRHDMDEFLYQLARRYADVAVGAIREVDRNHLIFSPGCINSRGYPTREPVLRAFSDAGIDVFCLAFSPLAPDLRGDNRAYDITGKPVFVWYGVTAAHDSGMHAFRPAYAAPNFPTQEQRGAAYARDLLNFYEASAKNGDHYIIGIDFWELVDNSSERTNWGLLSRRDNAYDGKQAVEPYGRDGWGYRTGGEDRNYGDFLSMVRNTNFEIQDRLARDLAPFARNSGKGKR
jgi:hypothetical protein